MKELYKVDSIQLSELLQKKKIRCKNDVQRDFEWDIDVCLKLFEDILNEQERYYGINSMGFSTINGSRENLECYDGQQRLTTYTLLLFSIFLFIDNEYTSSQKEKLKENISQHYYNHDVLRNVEKLSFIPNDGNNENIKIFQEILKKQTYDEYENYVSDHKLEKNKYVNLIKHLYNEIKGIYNEEDRSLVEYYDELADCYKGNTNNIKCNDDYFNRIVSSIIEKPAIILYIGSEKGKYDHFINQSKGQDLEPSAYFKTTLNKLKNDINDSEKDKITKINEFIQLFNDAKYLTDTNGGYKINKNILTYINFFTEKNGKYIFKNRKVNNNLILDIFENYDNFNSIENINKIIKIAQISIDIDNITNNRKSKFLNENDDNYKMLYHKIQIITKILRINDTLNPIIILLLMKYYNDYQFIINCLNVLIKYSFLEYKIYNDMGNVDIRKLIIKIANLLNKNKDVSKLNNLLKNEINERNKNNNTSTLIKFNELKDVSVFFEKKIKKDKKLLQYILREYYKSHEDVDSEEISFNDLSFEHIIPHKYNKNYSYLQNEMNDNETKQLINSLGNQMFLKLDSNKKIGNKPIKDKIKIYEKSKFDANILFVNKLKKIKNYEIELPNLIKERHSEIIDFIYDHFSL